VETPPRNWGGIYKKATAEPDISGKNDLPAHAVRKGGCTVSWDYTRFTCDWFETKKGIL